MGPNYEEKHFENELKDNNTTEEEYNSNYEVLEYWENLPHVEEGDQDSQQVESIKRMRRTKMDRTSMLASAHALSSRVEESLAASSSECRFVREALSVTGPRPKRKKVLE